MLPNDLPPFLGACEDFCCDRALFRLLFFFLPPVALTERSKTSLALKNATRNGCLDCGPLLPMMPADFMLILLPSSENREMVLRCIYRLKVTLSTNLPLSEVCFSEQLLSKLFCIVYGHMKES